MKTHNGMTLVEVSVVVALVGILATIAALVYATHVANLKTVKP